MKLLGTTLFVTLMMTACGQAPTASKPQSDTATAHVDATKVAPDDKTADVVYGNFKLQLTGAQQDCNVTVLSVAPGFVTPMAAVETTPTANCQKSVVDDARAYNITAFNLQCGGRLYEGKSVQGDVVQIYDYRDTNCDGDHSVKMVETRAGSKPQTFVGAVVE